MDKNLHKKLNIIETSCVLAGITCMLSAAMMHMGTRLSVLNVLFMMVAVLVEVTIVSIELILFHLEEVPYKALSIGYYVVELVATMLVNATIPFSGLIVLTTMSILKNVFRVLNVDKIYKRLGYYELCKKFGIKVKKPRKARVVATKKATTPVKNPAKRKQTKSTEPNYA